MGKITSSHLTYILNVTLSRNVAGHVVISIQLSQQLNSFFFLIFLPFWFMHASGLATEIISFCYLTFLKFAELIQTVCLSVSLPTTTLQSRKNILICLRKLFLLTHFSSKLRIINQDTIHKERKVFVPISYVCQIYVVCIGGYIANFWRLTFCRIKTGLLQPNTSELTHVEIPHTYVGT